MRVLVLGAGATGGYFGGRLAQAGADVTFLVRPARQARLREQGLRIVSTLGDATLPVATITGEVLAAGDAPRFDLVLLACKAYDLDSAMDAIAPAIDAGAHMVPLLNGLLHYDALDARFGFDQVAGGLCFISAALGSDGEIQHFGRPASITFGERAGQAKNDHLQALADACAQADVEHLHADNIAQAQWNKFSFLATLAAGTCAMRSSIGEITAAEGGTTFMTALHEECLAVAAAEGQEIPVQARDAARAGLTASGSDVKSSMLRDLEAGNRVEAAHIVGDMLHRAKRHDIAAPRLQAAWIHLQAYTARNR